MAPKISFMKFDKLVLLFGLFLSLISVYGKELGDTPYFVLMIMSVLIIINRTVNAAFGWSLVLKTNFRHRGHSKIDKLFSKTLILVLAGVVMSWGYGALLGVINLVPFEYVFRNYFGLLLYLLVPIIIMVSPNSKELIYTVMLAGLVQAAYGFTSVITGLLYDPYRFLIESNFYEARSLYSTGYVAIFPLFTLTFAMLILPKKSYLGFFNKTISTGKLTIVCLLSLCALIVPSMSKGYMLAAILLAALLIAISLYYSIITRKVNRRQLLIILFVLAFSSYLTIFHSDLIVYNFSSSEDSNFVRSEQYSYLIAELDWLGHGLGSSLASGYARDETGYGMELSYLNLIHKLGVLSVFLFTSYFITIVVSVLRIIRGIALSESIFSIGLMGYLIVGAGNPVLISPTGVTLHSIAIYILLKPFITRNILRSNCAVGIRGRPFLSPSSVPQSSDHS